MKQRMTTVRERGPIVLVVLALTLVLAACSTADEGAGGIAVEAVTLEGGAASIRVDVGQMRPLVVEVSPAGAEASDLTWVSSDTSVVTVEDGVVTGIDAGTALVTVRSSADEAVHDSIEVEVGFRTGSPVAIESVQVDTVAGSRFVVEWEAQGEATFDVVALPSEDSRDAALLAREVTTGSALPLPTSDRPWIGLVAREADGAEVDRVAVELRNVVTTSRDYDPYDEQGFVPEPEVPGSLRYLVQHADPGTVIGFAADIRRIELHGVDLEDVEEGPAADAHLIPRTDVTISGPEGDPVTLEGVSGAPADHESDPFTWRSRVVFVPAEVEVVLENLILTGGTFIYQGGGIRNDGRLTFRGGAITGNRAWEYGGGIQNRGVLHLEDSLVSGNEALTTPEEVGATFRIRGDYEIRTGDTGWGGGIDAAAGTLTMVRSVISDNTAKFHGGGLYQREVAFTNATDVDFSGNTAPTGSAIYHRYVGEPDNLELVGGNVTPGSHPGYHAEPVTEGALRTLAQGSNEDEAEREGPIERHPR